MDERLKKLFEYQKFEQNSRLAAIINNAQTQTSEAVELSDDQLFGVAGGAGQSENYEEMVRKAKEQQH